MPRRKLKDLVVLTIGRGGREATLAWKIAQSPLVKEVIVAPGNYGISCMRIRGTKIRCVKIDEMNFEKLIEFAQKNKVNLTVVGPEAPLVDGIVDAFTINDLLIFGPTRKAARLEGSKWFAKQHMNRYGVPTAQAELAETSEQAWKLFKKFAGEYNLPVVIKADGLWGGKGVFICKTPEEGHAAIETIFAKDNQRVLIEQFVPGNKNVRRAEISVLALVSADGSMKVLPESQDYKARFDNDRGGNTGGMGAFSPVSWYTPGMHVEVVNKILLRTIVGMIAEGWPFSGCLYAGLKFSPTGMQVLEFNVRFGDPEAQVVIPRIKSDIVPILIAAARGENLFDVDLECTEDAAVCVVKCSKDYPNSCSPDHIICGTYGARKGKGRILFPSGVKRGRHGSQLASGGRIYGATGLGPNLKIARQRAYLAADAIYWEKDGKDYSDCRRDIGLE